MTQSAFDAITGFFSTLFSWLLDGALVVIKASLFFIFDGILTVVTVFFTAIDLSAFLSTYALSWAGVPEQLIWFVNAVSVPQGVTMLVAAIGIRKTLDLIPAALTRV